MPATEPKRDRPEHGSERPAGFKRRRIDGLVSHSNVATLEPMTSGFHFGRRLYSFGDVWSHHKNLDASFHTASVVSGPVSNRP